MIKRKASNEKIQKHGSERDQAMSSVRRRLEECEKEDTRCRNKRLEEDEEEVSNEELYGQLESNNEDEVESSEDIVEGCDEIVSSEEIDDDDYCSHDDDDYYDHDLIEDAISESEAEKAKTTRVQQDFNVSKQWIAHCEIGLAAIMKGGRLYLGEEFNPFNLHPIATKIRFVTAGQKHILYLSSDHDLFTYGDNEWGQLGVGDRNERRVPEIISLPYKEKPWLGIAAGSHHSFAVTQEGIWYGWGRNEQGESRMDFATDTDFILEGEAQTSPNFVRPPSDREWKEIIPGTKCTFGVTKSGEVYVCGYGTDGQLGMGNTIHQYSAQQLEAPYREKWSHIVPGGAHCFGITESGAVYVWGKGKDGQLGLGDSRAGQYTPHLLKPPNEHKWQEIAANGDYSFGRTVSGGVFSWGKRNVLGFGDCCSPNILKSPGVDRWKNFVGGYKCTFGITFNRKLFRWGEGGYEHQLCSFPKAYYPPRNEEWGLEDNWPLFRILFIGRIKEPDSVFFSGFLPLDLFKTICKLI